MATEENSANEGWYEMQSAGNCSSDAGAAVDAEIMLEGILREFSDVDSL